MDYFLEDSEEENNLEEELENYEDDENFELILSVDPKDIDNKVKELEKLGIKVVSIIRDILPANKGTFIGKVNRRSIHKS